MYTLDKTKLMPVKVSVRGKRGIYLSTRYKKPEFLKTTKLKVSKKTETTIAEYMRTITNKDTPTQLLISKELREHNKEIKLLSGSANGVFLYKDKYIFKPNFLENRAVRNQTIPSDNFWKREVLAYKIYKTIKDKMHFKIPKTFIAAIGKYEGSAQEYIKNTKSLGEMRATNNPKITKALLQLYLFDLIFLNDDRHFGNFLIKDDEVYAIDNGFIMPEIKETKEIEKRMYIGPLELIRGADKEAKVHLYRGQYHHQFDLSSFLQSGFKTKKDIINFVLDTYDNIIYSIKKNKNIISNMVGEEMYYTYLERAKDLKEKQLKVSKMDGIL